MPSTTSSSGQPVIATNRPRGPSPSPTRQPIPPSVPPNGRPSVPFASSSTSQTRNIGQPHNAQALSFSISKIWQQCNLATTLLCTILMVVLGFLLFKPQTLATKLALWESKKDYQEYCKTINQTGSTVSRDCLDVLGKALPPPPSSKLLRRNLTDAQSQIEQTTQSEPWISSTVYGLLTFFVVSIICLALLRLFLVRRKRAMFTVDMDCHTGVPILDHRNQYTPISSGPAWVPNFVAQSTVSVIRRTVIRAGAKETGWTSTIEVNDKPGRVKSRKRKAESENLLELWTHGNTGDPEYEGSASTDTDTSTIFTFEEQKEEGSGSDQDEWEPVAKLGISNFKRPNPPSDAGIESPPLESPSLESPSLESPSLESPSLESPSLESPLLWGPSLLDILSNRTRFRGIFPVSAPLAPSGKRDSDQGMEGICGTSFEGPLKRRKRLKWLGYWQAYFLLNLTTGLLCEYSHLTSPTLVDSMCLSTASVQMMEKSQNFSIEVDGRVWDLKANDSRSFKLWKLAFSKLQSNISITISSSYSL